MKKLLIISLCVTLLSCMFPSASMAAPDWPNDISIEAGGGIVMDAATGTVLYGKEIHTSFHPASITKVMTALVVLEKCSLDEEVVFSKEAVYNVEANSSNAGISEGDKMTVKDCLYALLFKSANEAGNALAEHISGSNEDFAKLMTERALSLGCENTNFSNPSGLNDDKNYTSPYDMALISVEAFKNPTFVEIMETPSYRLPPTQKDPEGLVVASNHRMMRKDDSLYYPGIIGGKPGYTSQTGNTLVTCVERDGMRLICVVLKGSQPQYWSDTKALLDFGFDNFQTVKIGEHETTYAPANDNLEIAGLSKEEKKLLELDPDGTVVLPKTSEFADADAELSFDVDAADPEGTVAKIKYTYNDRAIGTGIIKTGAVSTASVNTTVTSTDVAAEQTKTEGTTASSKSTNSNVTPPVKNPGPKGPSVKIPVFVWIGIAVVLVLGALIGTAVFLKIRTDKREEEARRIRREKRQQRLKEAGISDDDFEAMLEQRKNRKS